MTEGMMTPCRRWPRRAVLAALVAAVVLTAAGAVVRQRRATDAILREGEGALASHDYAKARERFGKYLEERPRDPRGLLLAARAARQAREFYEAGELLKRCREMGGDAEAIATEEALAEVQRGKRAPTPELRERGRRGDELALAILEVLIQYDLDTYRLNLALDELTRYLDARPHDLNALVGRGYVWERFLYFADAVADYRRAVAAHPENETARQRLAATLLVAGTPGEALEHFEWLAGKYPERRDIKLGKARCLRRLGRPEEAARLLDELLAEGPSDAEALGERGQIELDSDRPAAAELLLRRALAAAPHDRQVNHSLAQCLRAQGRGEAADFDERVRRIDDDLRRLDRARTEVLKRPDDPALRCEVGALFLRNGEREEGLRWLRAALALDPLYAPARAELEKAELEKADPTYRK
jgi:tetratricopeptide (TPR) repeat protein